TDPPSISWRRCVDINDRALRDIALGLGGRANGYPRQTGFDITAASEVMAIVAVARDLFDLRARLGAITVGSTYEGEPVTAEQLRATGAMTVLLKETIKPNLVQTLEGQPAFVHCGPFANIAHGNSSLVADRIGLNAVVAVNRFPADTDEEIEQIRRIALANGAFAAEANEAVVRGGEGAAALAEAVVAATEQPSTFAPVYPLDDSIERKIEAI